jgi:hypothetical protein
MSAADVDTRRGIDAQRHLLLARLSLTYERTLSDDGDSFSTLVCRDADGDRVVLKYMHSDSPDGRRRLTNETKLLTLIPSLPPMRVLRHRASGIGYVVTDFDDGVLLRGPAMDDDRISSVVAEALARLHSIRIDFAQHGIVDREDVARYYVKVLTKHLLHLWPSLLTAKEAAQCLSLLRSALPDIAATVVPTHGDLMPTNLLYNAGAGSVTFTDFEGFQSANHRLFDVLALCSVSDRPLDEWHWQARFIQTYLRAAAAPGLAFDNPAFRAAYRAILVFFLAYRLNEARLLARNESYFDGLPKRTYVLSRARRLLLTRHAWRHTPDAADVAVYGRNLRCALNRDRFAEHFMFMQAARA